MQLLLTVGVILFGCLTSAGQSAAAGPMFEVVSVKRIEELPPMGGGCQQEPTRLDCPCALMSTLLRMAYAVDLDQIVGPSWVRSDALPGLDMFAVEAKFPEGTTRDEFRLMLQSMLAERFRLALHYEKRETSVYALQVAPSGLKLKTARSAADPGEKVKVLTGRRGLFRDTAAPISALIKVIRTDAGRPILDMTHLDGLYNIELEWAPTGRAQSDAAPDLPDVFSALQLQLGLRLVPQKAQFDVLVIDKVNKTPTEN